MSNTRAFKAGLTKPIRIYKNESVCETVLTSSVVSTSYASHHIDWYEKFSDQIKNVIDPSRLSMLEKWITRTPRIEEHDRSLLLYRIELKKEFLEIKKIR